ncbi:MAG: TonB-dependent receptor, partial [Chitinophagaceae bacterium]|nr:TonB-dependent receptor [Chitinophagaceae bacterium]
VQAVAFLKQYRNILGSDNVSGGGMGSGNMFNAGNARIGGLEFMAQGDLVKPSSRQAYKMPIGISYTYTHARFLEAFVNAGGDWGNGNIIKNDAVPFVTPHMFSFNMGYERKLWNITASGRYTGITRVKPSHGDYIMPSSAQALNNINALPAFFILDVSANYKLNQSFSLFTQCGNVSNSKAIVANLPQGYRPNMPFSVLFGVKAQW